ncbi:coiled-coil domain-containing protein 88B-like [Grus americana]|uniref:coiled-coil domain-containing protein 88B-like n=1 Tax=Grus americana TaxID=9117 RepID=UPI0024078990|nr:coiled-coil domain-containing protein 88B-like [Grus americana]
MPPLGTVTAAGQAAELGQLERALALAQAERAAAVAEAGQRATEVARLREEVAELRAELRRGQELSARYRLEAATLRANARLRDRQHRGATAQVAWLREELDRLRAQQEALGEEHRALQHRHHRLGRHLRGTHSHRCPEGLWGTACVPPVSPPAEDPEDAQPPGPEGTHSQETTGGLKPFILFIVASTLIFLHPYLKQS